MVFFCFVNCFLWLGNGFLWTFIGSRSRNWCLAEAKHAFEWGTVKLTIAHHGSMLPDGSCGGNPAGVLLKLSAGTIYHAADTGLFYDMKLIGETGVDLAIVPIGDNFTMGPDDALKAVQLIEPKRVIPDHYDTWPLIAQDAGAWAERVRAETSADPLVMAPGDSCELN